MLTNIVAGCILYIDDPLDTDSQETITDQFETVQSARVVLGGGEGAPDRETPRTRFCINVDAKAFVHEDNGFTRDVQIQLWITPTQIADIVKAYFSDLLCHTGKVYLSMCGIAKRQQEVAEKTGVPTEEVEAFCWELVESMTSNDLREEEEEHWRTFKTFDMPEQV